MGARLGDQRQFDRQFQIGLEFHRFTISGFRRQPAQLGIALAFPSERGDRSPRRGQGDCPGVQYHDAGGAIDHSEVARLDRMRQSDGAQHGGTPSARSMTEVWSSAPPSSVATPASREGSNKRRVGRPQRLA